MFNGLSKATGRVQRAGENRKGDNDGTKPGHYQNTSLSPLRVWNGMSTHACRYTSLFRWRKQGIQPHG